mgnify:CR=1 FL=1
MALSKIQAESMNLADTFAFSGTATGAGTKTLLADTTISSATASVEFKHGTGDVIFDSTYSRYELTVDRVIPVTNSNHLELFISTNAGNSYFGDSQYNTVIKRFYSNGSDTTDDVNYRNDFIAEHQHNTHSDANRGGANGTVLISSMGQVNRTVAYGNFWGFGQSYYLHSHTLGAVESNGDDMTAVKWQFGSGNISSGRFKLYGVK